MVSLGLLVVSPCASTPPYIGKGQGVHPTLLGPAAKGLPCPQGSPRVWVAPPLLEPHGPWGPGAAGPFRLLHHHSVHVPFRYVGPTMGLSGTF